MIRRKRTRCRSMKYWDWQHQSVNCNMFKLNVKVVMKNFLFVMKNFLFSLNLTDSKVSKNYKNCTFGPYPQALIPQFWNFNSLKFCSYPRYAFSKESFSKVDKSYYHYRLLQNHHQASYQSSTLCWCRWRSAGGKGFDDLSIRATDSCTTLGPIHVAVHSFI